MKITREQLHGAIAERLEPNPEMPRDLDGTIEFDSLSPLGLWCWGSGIRLCPVNFSKSEDASARLLDAMRKGDSTGMRTSHFRGLLTRLLFTNDDRKTVALLAAKEWLEIEGELLEDSK